MNVVEMPFVSAPLAIVGMDCHLPGADGLEQYWDLLIHGRSAIGELPSSRLDRQLYYDPHIGRLGKTYCTLAGTAPPHPRPASFFRLSADDIENADMSHLELCRVVAGAFRHAGWDPSLTMPGRTGVYMGHTRGTSLSGDLLLNAYLDQALHQLRATRGFAELPESQQAAWIAEITTNLRSRLAGRHPDGGPHLDSNEAPRLVAKSFGLNGPTMALNAACSSTLVALAFGGAALQLGDIDVAVIGGASYCKLDTLLLFSKAQSISGNGTRPFDARADGLIPSDGYVVVVLKTLERALRDGDPIQAVVRGIGMSSDGRGKSLWAPRKEGQIAAVHRAYSGEFAADRMQYIEAHATSTPLGDATEIEGLSEALRDVIVPGRKIPIGSVKANIGHTLEPAGLAALIKTVLAMQHERIPPVANYECPNPKIQWEQTPFVLPTAAMPWPQPPDGGRCAGVNAFGIGGLNVHVVLEQYVPQAAPRKQLTAVAAPHSSSSTASGDRAIAVVGMGVVAPGARSVAAFRQLLIEGRDPKTTIPIDRWNATLAPFADAAHWKGGFVEHFIFDWRKHRIPPKQIELADPLQFMILDAVDQALESTGWRQWPAPQRTGVIMGNIFGGEFLAQLQISLRLPELRQAIDQHLRAHGWNASARDAVCEEFAERVINWMPALLDESGSFTTSTLASRITKTFDLMGLACTIDGGDASSLLALDTSRNLLLCGALDLAICGAGHRAMGPDAYEKLLLTGRLQQGKAAAAEDNSAGIVPGEGAAVVLLKRLADARRDGDRILAVFRDIGIARDDDLRQSNAKAIARSFRSGDVKPEFVSAVDCTRSGLAAHDKLAQESLAQHYHALPHSSSTDDVSPLIGHLGGASGMMALIHSVCSMQAIPEPSRRTTSAPVIDPQGRVFCALHSTAKELSCHLVLERGELVPQRESGLAAVPATANNDDDFRIWRCEADSYAQLVAFAADLASATSPAQASSNGRGGRFGMAIVYRNQEELRNKARLVAQHAQEPPKLALLDAQAIYLQQRAGSPRLAFVFPGQGSQYRGMLQHLVTQHEVAARVAATNDAILQSLGFPTFRELTEDAQQQLGRDLWRTQLSLLAAESILFAVISDMGLRPHRITAHSYGEFPALHAAGAWDFRNAAMATFHRCRLITQAARVDAALMQCGLGYADADDICQKSPGQFYVSSSNADDQTVIAGVRQDVLQLCEQLQQRGVRATVLDVPPAPFHTPLLRDVQPALRDCLATIELQPPQIPLLSSVDNRYVADPDIIRSNLVRQLVQPVPYVQQIRRLASEGARLIVEIGPSQVLTRLNQRILGGRDVLLVASDAKNRCFAETQARLQAALIAAGISSSTSAKDDPPVPRTTSAVARPAEPAAKVAATNSNGPQRSESPTQNAEGLLEIAGTPHAMGVAQGRRYAATIQRLLARYAKLHDEPLGRRLPNLAHVKRNLHDLLDEAARDEIRGIAEGAGVDGELLLDHNLYSHFEIAAGCTQVLLRGNDRRWLHAANEDLPLSLLLRDSLQRCVQIRRPQDGQPHLLLAAVGHCSGINGINAAGLTITSSMLLDLPASTETSDGLLHAVLVRRILEQARSVNDALHILESHSTSGNWGMCIADRDGEAVYVEYQGATRRTERVTNDKLVTNHARLLSSPWQVPDHSRHRLERLETLHAASRKQGTVGPGVIQAWLRDRYDGARAREVRFSTMNTIRRVDHQGSVIFDIGGARVWVTGSHAGQNDDAYDELDLAQLFGITHESVSTTHRPVTTEHAQVTKQTITARRETVIDWPQFARLAKSDQPPADDADPQRVCHRFSLRCVPLAAVPAADVATTCRGGAVIIGANPQAAALAQRLTDSGVRCCHLSRPEDLAASLTQLDAFWQHGTAPHLFLLTSFDADALGAGNHCDWQRRRLAGLLHPYQLCQRWFALLEKSQQLEQASIVAGTRLGGFLGADDQVDSPEGGFATGLIKALRMEQGIAAQSSFRACVVDFDRTADTTFVAQRLIDELAGCQLAWPEIGYRDGRRHALCAIPQPAHDLPAADVDYGRVWVVTGGARGVTAEVARALGRQLHVKLHLLGSTELTDVDPQWSDVDEAQLRELRAQVTRAALERGEVPIDAWSRVVKAIEIDKNLRSFAAEGVDVTYHACDVSDRQSLSRVLQRIRQQDGGIDGILHGAGFELAARFPNKKLNNVQRTVEAKVDGALALIEQTADDPLKFFVAFGSISGRFGGVGQSDYCLANDMLSKIVAWLRAQRPDVHATTLAWHSWGGVGMAMRPESRHAKTLAKATFMPIQEGVEHCLNEIRRGCPEGEALITDWRRFKACYPDQLLTSTLAAAEAPAQHEPPRATQSTAPQATPKATPFALTDGVSWNGHQQLVTTLVVSPRDDVFLAEHNFRGRPMFPLVAMIEAIAEAGSILQGRRLTVIENLIVEQSMRFFTDDPRDVRVQAMRNGERIACRLVSDFRNRQGELVRPDLLHATCSLPTGKLNSSARVVSLPNLDWHAVQYPEGKAIHVGSLYRQMLAIGWEGDTLWGKMRVPDAAEFAGRRRGREQLFPCVLIDVCLFAAGADYWRRNHGFILPRAIEGIEQFALPVAGELAFSRTRWLGHDGGDALYDVELFDESGRALLSLHRYRATSDRATLQRPSEGQATQ